MATGQDLAEQLLRTAGDDQAAARAMLPLKVTDAIVGFHAQQAVEKSIKAVLAARNVDFPFIHDMGALPDFARRRERLCGMSLMG